MFIYGGNMKKQKTFLKNKQLKRISEKWNSQLTKDRRYDKVSKSSTKRQQNLNSKMFEKTWKSTWQTKRDTIK